MKKKKAANAHPRYKRAWNSSSLQLWSQIQGFKFPLHYPPAGDLGEWFQVPLRKASVSATAKMHDFKVVVSIKINAWYITGIHMKDFFFFFLFRPFVNNSGPRIFIPIAIAWKYNVTPDPCWERCVFTYKCLFICVDMQERLWSDKTDFCNLKPIWGHSYFPELNTTEKTTWS